MNLIIKQMESKGEEPEIINVWELMSGLDDDELSPRSMAFPAIPAPKHLAVSTALAAKLSSDPFTLEPSNARPKPFFQPSLKVDGSHGRSPFCASEDRVMHMSASPHKFNPMHTSSSSGSSLFGSVSGSNASSVEILADNLQRSLSFKLAFNSENKGILGLGDTLFSKDDFSYEAMVANLHSNRRASEGDSETSSSASFSASAKLKKWFKANKRGLKLPNVMKGRLKSSMQEAQEKKVLSKSATSSNARALLFSESSGKMNDNGSNRMIMENGSSGSVSDSGSSSKGSNEFSESSRDTTHVFTNAHQNKIMGAAQGGPARRRYRHSFSNGNPKKQSTEESAPPAAPINRPSSWELENVVVEPGGKAVLYSTSARTDINAYEDSNAVRAILISLVGASFDEKSISQHPDYEQELKNVLNLSVVTVPTVCVRGKYIAGIDNIMQLFKKGILGSLLLETLPHGLKPNAPCMCRGGKFLICPLCKGKRKLTRQGEEAVICRHCIGTGLLKCPSCPKP